MLITTNVGPLISRLEGIWWQEKLSVFVMQGCTEFGLLLLLWCV